jgi:mono/diheme cytochrome c family protein
MIAVLLALVLAASAYAAAPAADVALYGQWCARCHGDQGDGKGPASAALAFNGAPPRDFTAGRFKVTSVRSGTAPTDDDLVSTIATGMPGTSMPAFDDLLTGDEIRRLAGVVRSFATTPRSIGTPLDLGAPPPDDDASRARGAVLYRELGCPTCHGDRGRGDGPSASQLRASDGSRIAAADLTRPWTFKGGGTPGDVAMRLAAGIGGTPMPSYLDAATRAQLWDVAHWIASIARAPSLRASALMDADGPAGADVAPRERGEYVAKSGTCFLCHVQMQPDGRYVEGSFGAGGMPITITHTITVHSRNLTPEPDTGIGRWTAADLGRALRDGTTPTGRRLSVLDMPWTILGGVTDADVEALHAYFQSLPPVRNLVPDPAFPPLHDALGRKAVALAIGALIQGGFSPGSGGRVPAAGETIAPAANPTDDLWLALGCVLVLVLHLALRGRRHRLEALAVGGLLTMIPLVHAWPLLHRMPVDLVKAEGAWAPLGQAMNLPPLRPPPAVVDEDPLARRGRYVATLGTCSLCHTAGPSVTRPWAPFPEMGGGMRVNWKVFGTTYSRNLTPDRDTGLGAWSDAQVKRAITSGLSRDGRVMHWQAMPWDHFSRLTPEDLEALVHYLRRLPAVRSVVPSPAPPAPGDADADSFGFGYSGRRDH